MSFRLTVPGNLLLAGEYAVLEPGGLGLAVAVEPRLECTVFPASDWELVGRWPGTEERWSPGQTPNFAGSVFLAARDALLDRGDERGRRWDRDIAPARLVIDSSPLFDSEGRKRGFGSSAALAVAITAALAHLQGRTHDVHHVAVQAHRTAQGGAGSGYDVTASYFGGLGLFTGGEKPTWLAIAPQVLPFLAVFSGPKAVRTTRSIDLYRQWQNQHPSPARSFLERSNEAVARLCRAASWPEFKESWAVCRELGLELGEDIGCSAELSGPYPWIKALGAGNETGLAAGDREEFPRVLPAGLDAVQVAETGVVWE